jgi:hypothetical protein
MMRVFATSATSCRRTIGDYTDTDTPTLIMAAKANYGS